MSSTSEDRSQFIGSSDIAAIMGLSPWRTAYEVWAEKVGESAPDDVDPERERRFRRGKRMEPVVVEMLQEEHDFVILDRNARIYHPTHPFLSAERDFAYGLFNQDDGDLERIGHGEAKSVDPRQAHQWEEDGSQEVPPYYMAQAMFGMAMDNAPEATVAAMFGYDLRVYRFERDDELCGALVQKAVDFWNNHVLPKVPPPPQTKEDAAALVRKFAGFSFEASDDLKANFAGLREAKKFVKQWQQNVETIEAMIYQSMTTHITAHGEIGIADKFTVLDGGKPVATWNQQHRGAYTVQPTTFRVLRLKREK